MNRNFERALSAVLKHEGGYVDHPKDPGGATNLGVTIGTLSGWLGRKATKAEVKALTVKDVGPLYRSNYWDKVRGDDLPAGLDYAVFDFAVNSGPFKAASSLQTILGVASDGEIGPVTLAAVAEHSPAELINELCAHRLAFLERLSTWPTFGKGWVARVTGTRKLALELAAMEAAPAPTAPAEPKPQPTAPAAPGKGRGVVGLIILALAALGGVIAGAWQHIANLFGF